MYRRKDSRRTDKRKVLCGYRLRHLQKAPEIIAQEHISKGAVIITAPIFSECQNALLHIAALDHIGEPGSFPEQRCKVFGNRYSRPTGKRIDCRKFVSVVVDAERRTYGRRELIRRCCRRNNDFRVVARVFLVFASRIQRNCGMRVRKIVEFTVNAAYTPS